MSLRRGVAGIGGHGLGHGHFVLAWGITMNRDIAVSPLPEFECTITGNTVRIDSTGTAGLDVNLGAGGLGLSGTVTVIWNGTKAYEGPASAIELGKGAKRRR